MQKHTIGWALVLAGLSPWAQAAPGEYWEITNKVQMQGMSMPGMTSKVCIPKGAEGDPRNSADKDCQMTDMKSSGNKSSWKMRCDKNGEVMTGSGEMTATADRTEGTISFSSAKTGNMTMSFVNKRVGGACDSDELKKKYEAQAAANNKEMLKMCEGANTTRDWLGKAPMIVGKDAICAGKKDQFCDLMKRDAGRDVDLYFNLKQPEPAISKSCGISMDAAKKSICKSVDANNADFTKQMRGNTRLQYTQSLRSECPAEMKLYAELSRKRFCEGRGFTEQKRVSLADCLKGASGDDQAMHTADPDEPATGSAKSPAADKTEQSTTGKLLDGLKMPSLPGGGNSGDAVIDGAKKLKNLFGL
jgi:hypothetical protein